MSSREPSFDIHFAVITCSPAEDSPVNCSLADVTVSIPLFAKGQQLLYYRPFVYHWQPGKVDVAKLAAVARGDRVVEAPWFRRAEFASRERTLSVVSFAKSRLFGRGNSFLFVNSVPGDLAATRRAQ